MNSESEISFKDLVFYIFRNILIVFIAGAIVGCAFGLKAYFVKSTTNDVLDVSKKLNSSETDYQYQARVISVSRARTFVKMIENTNKEIDYEREYISDSVFMQIDPNKVYQSTAQISITLQGNYTNGVEDTLISAYGRDLLACDYLADYASGMGKKLDFIKELFSFSSADVVDKSINVNYQDLKSTSSFYICIVGPSQEFCDDIMSSVLNEINRIHGELNTSVAAHSYSVVSVQNIVESNNFYREKQNEHMIKIDSLQADIVNYYIGLSNLAEELGLSDNDDFIKYFETHEEVFVDGVPTDYSEQTVKADINIKSLIKKTVIGFVIGSALVIVWFVICYLFSKKVISQTQFFGLFPDLVKIGVMKPVGKRNAYVSFLDKCCEDDTELSCEKLNKLITTNCNNLTKDYKKILITGVGDKNSMDSALKELKLNGDYMPNLFDNPEVLDKVFEYDCVVLLEQRNVSLYRDIKNEIRLISNSGTKIVGAILI